jgi:hypothetical protein
MDARPFLLHLAAAFLAACAGGPAVSGTPFPCGPDMETCQPGQFCLSVANYGMPTYTGCTAFPSSCLSTPTCDCIRSATAGTDDLGCSLDTCAEDSAGHATASCEIP